MERKRAAERNEKTDSITKERRRIRELEAEVLELREWKAERLREEEDTEEERERLAGLLEDLAEDLVGKAPERRLEWGEGLSHRVLTDEDLLRVAELIDPDGDEA